MGHNLETVTPELTCPNSNDRFTVSTDNGNGALTYPIALITADEVAYAGSIVMTHNHDYYLYTNSHYWTMTPNLFSTSSDANGKSLVWAVFTDGRMNNNDVMTSTNGIRPAISLKAGTTAISGDGTASNPYVIE